MHTGARIVDLTHDISPAIPTFDGACGFELPTTVDYHDCTAPNVFRVQRVAMKAGIGTHIDAPAHAIPGGMTIEQLELPNLVTDCVVIRAREEAREGYLFMPADIEAFEKEHGTIAPNTLVLFFSGWDRFWDRPETYLGAHAYPSVHASAAELLLARDIAGIGIDTLSADAGGNDFPVHRLVLGAAKYLIENVANLAHVPPAGATVVVLPMKMADATEAPVRMIALL